MNFPIHVDTISTDLSILYFKGQQGEFSGFQYNFVLEHCILANGTDPDEMPHHTLCNYCQNNVCTWHKFEVTAPKCELKVFLSSAYLMNRI